MTAISTTLPTSSAPAGLDDEVAALIRESLAHPAVRHPLLTRFASGDYRDGDAVLRQYALEYSGYASWFPHCLENVIPRLPEPRHQALLLGNLEAQQGHLGDGDCAVLRRVGIHPQSVMNVPHAMLFRRFSESLGVTDEALVQPSPAAMRWRTRLLHFLNYATAAQAVGALGLGTQTVLRPIYKQLLTGIIGLGTLRRDEFAYFELHCLVDDRHQLDLLAITRELAEAPGGVEELRSGMLTALHLRCEFWDHLYRGVLDSQLANPA